VTIRPSVTGRPPFTFIDIQTGKWGNFRETMGDNSLEIEKYMDKE
jgi:hypothetical protein